MVTPFSALGIVLPVLLPGFPQFVISKKCFPRFFPSFRAFFRDFRAQRKSRNSCTFDLASALLKRFFLQNRSKRLSLPVIGLALGSLSESSGNRSVLFHEREKRPRENAKMIVP